MLFGANRLDLISNKQPMPHSLTLHRKNTSKPCTSKAELPNEIISPVFKDEKNGTFKIISFYAKKARGLMARYLIQNRINGNTKIYSHLI